MEQIREILKRIDNPQSKATQEQVNILELLSRKLANSNREERAELKAEAVKLQYTNLWSDVLDLFDSSPIYDDCKGCGNRCKYLLNPFSLAESLYCPKCAEMAEKERLHKILQKTREEFLNSADSILRRNGVPSLFMKAKIDDFPPSAKKYTKTEKGLYLYGDRGGGKTHLAVALMREYLNDVKFREVGGHYEVDSHSLPIFVNSPELLLQIKESYTDGKSSEKAIIGKYTERDFLVIDDLGVEKISEWSMQILYIIINRRYQDEKKTIITSNLSLDSLAERLDDRIASRIVGMCAPVIINRQDRRIKRKEQ